MRVLIALDVNDEDLTNDAATFEDVRDALLARLGEIYPGPGETRGRVVAVADVTSSYKVVLDALQVGVEGLEDADTRDMIGVTEGQAEQARDALGTLSEPLSVEPSWWV